MPPKINLWLVAALLLGIPLRLINISALPVGFTPDEAAFGYNAYSILKTGLDEWSVPWYRLFYTNLQSFGDYKLPLYSFLALPSIAAFGLSEFSTRLPNAIMGITAIVAVYLLAKQLTHSSLVSGVSAFFLAISPWHIAMSRGAFEANLATCLLPLGLYFFLTQKILPSIFFFSLAFYSYHSARFILPFIIILAYIFYRPPWRKTVLFIAILFITLLPGLMSFINGGSSRVSDVGIFSPTGGWGAVADERFFARLAGLPDSVARFFSNKPQYLFNQLASNYLSYLSPQFFFTHGAGEGTYGIIPGRGLFYIFQLPLLLASLITLIRHPRRSLLFILFLILISFLPAALTKGPGYAANRAVVAVPFIIIFIAVGVDRILLRLPAFYRPSFYAAIIVASVLSLAAFTENYVFLSPRYLAKPMLSGYRELFTRFMPMEDQYDQIRVSRSLSEPHIYLAFFAKIDPVVYHTWSQTWQVYHTRNLRFLDQLDGYYLGKYRFGDLHLEDIPTEKVLVVGKTSEFSSTFPYYFQLFYPDGTPSLQVSRLN